MPVHVDVCEDDLVEIAGRVRRSFRTVRAASGQPAMKVFDVVEQSLGVKLSQVAERFMRCSSRATGRPTMPGADDEGAGHADRWLVISPTGSIRSPLAV